MPIRGARVGVSFFSTEKHYFPFPRAPSALMASRIGAPAVPNVFITIRTFIFFFVEARREAAGWG